MARPEFLSSSLVLALLLLVHTCGISTVDALMLLEPVGLEQSFYVGAASFGPPALTTRPTKGEAIFAEPQLACNYTTLTNKHELHGKIVVVTRGKCSFSQKAVALQLAGAIGMVVGQPEMRGLTGGADEEKQNLFLMADDGRGHYVRIPSEMITRSDWSFLKRLSTYERVVLMIGTPVSTSQYLR